MPAPKDPVALEKYKMTMLRVGAQNRLRRKGKTYLEIYGPKRAAEEARKRKERNIAFGPKPSNEMQKIHLQNLNATRRGRTYTEIYGSEEAARKQLRKRNESFAKTFDKKGRKYEERPYHWCNPEYEKWRKAVFARDNFSCLRCGKNSDNLQAHHIKPWAQFVELRYVVSNGMTLCKKPCHQDIHKEIRACSLFLKELKGVAK